jgi:hypothetical protein
MNLTEEWLLKNGVSRETLDEALRGVHHASGTEFDVSFEPLVRRDTRIWLGINGWRPASLNEMARSVKGKIHLKQRDRAIICEAARLAGVPRAIGRRQLSMIIRVPKGQRRWDGDALWKSTLDAAKHAGLIVDDGPVWFQQGTIVYDPVRGPLRTTLVIEDMPGGSGQRQP